LKTFNQVKDHVVYGLITVCSVYNFYCTQG
jgi:hypothetical protein